MVELMLSFSQNVILLNVAAVEQFISPASLWEGDMNAALASICCSALSALITFLTIAAEMVEFEHGDVVAVSTRQLYLMRSVNS